ncbi:flagellar hook-length control protein FliK [Hydrogenophaga sp.]|uniref:flagellar hook-length control protein FliK n=1 Tax=Hydrogenophaga sp. TaxID=1904254 RepID=UPI003569E581
MSDATVSSAPAAAGNATNASATRAGGKARTGDDQAPVGLFASLLALVGATQGPATALGPGEAGTDASPLAPGDGSAALPEATDNPLLALLGWMTPAPLQATAAAQDPGASTAPAQDADATGLTALDGSGDTPLDAQTTDGAIPLGQLGLRALKEAQPAPTLATPTPAPESASTDATAQAPAAATNTPLRSPPSAVAATMATETVQTAAPARKAAATSVSSLRSSNLAPETSRASSNGLGSGRSTVDLNERYSMGKALEATTTASAASTAPAAAASAESLASRLVAPGASGPDTAPGTPAFGGAENRASPRAESALNAGAAPDGSATLDTADAEAHQLNTWSSAGVRHASLRVGEGSQEAIDVRMSLSGQDMHLDFRTDSAETRAHLQHNASQSLGEMLQRSGIQLGHVSVGSQGQPQERPSEQGSAPGHSGRGGVGDGGSDDSRPVARPPQQRADGSHPLDLFV